MGGLNLVLGVADKLWGRVIFLGPEGANMCPSFRGGAASEVGTMGAAAFDSTCGCSEDLEARLVADQKFSKRLLSGSSTERCL